MGNAIEAFIILQTLSVDAVNGAGKWMLGNRVDVYRGRTEHVEGVHWNWEVHAMWCTTGGKQCCIKRGIGTWQTWSGKARQEVARCATGDRRYLCWYQVQGHKGRSKGSAGSTSPCGLEHQVPGTRQPAGQVRRSLTPFYCPLGQLCESQCDTPMECWLLVMNGRNICSVFIDIPSADAQVGFLSLELFGRLLFLVQREALFCIPFNAQRNVEPISPAAD